MNPFVLLFCLQTPSAPCLLSSTIAAVPEVATAEASATPAKSASAILGRVQKFYEGNAHLKAKFRQEVINATFGKSTISDGRVFIAKPGKMRWDFYGKKTRNRDRKVSRSFVSNGEGLFAVFHDTKQVFVKSMEDDLLPVAITFLHGTGNLLSDFDAEIDKSGKYGTPDDVVLKLKPKAANAQYKFLWLVVAPNNYRVRESIVLNAKEDVNHFRFFEPDFSSHVPGNLFTVDHPDYDVVDRNSKPNRKSKRRRK